MAYFPNGSAGMCFDDQCTKCIFGKKACPIAWVQIDNNYEAANNPVARKILDYLVKSDGTCAMYKEFKSKLSVDSQTSDFSLETLRDLENELEKPQIVKTTKLREIQTSIKDYLNQKL